MWWLALLACDEAAPPAAPPAPAPEAPAPAGLHGSHSEHMRMMSATRDRLRQELGAAYDAPVPGLDAADAAQGAALFATHCAGCHGPGGKGDGPAGKDLNPPPSDMTDAFHARYYSDAGRVHIVRNGSPGTAMAGFQGTLKDEEILAVYRHVAGFRAAPGQ